MTALIDKPGILEAIRMAWEETDHPRGKDGKWKAKHLHDVRGSSVVTPKGEILKVDHDGKHWSIGKTHGLATADAARHLNKLKATLEPGMFGDDGPRDTLTPDNLKPAERSALSDAARGSLNDKTGDSRVIEALSLHGALKPAAGGKYTLTPLGKSLAGNAVEQADTTTKATKTGFDASLAPAEHDGYLFADVPENEIHGRQARLFSFRLSMDGTWRFAIMRAPKGGVTIAGKFYRGGLFIPNSQFDKATPEVKEKVEEANEGHRDRLRKQGQPDHGKMREQIASHADTELSPEAMSQVRRTWAALKHHHQDLVMHRVSELIQLDKAELAKGAAGPNRTAMLHKRLRAYGHMLDWAEKDLQNGKIAKHGIHIVPVESLHVDPARFQYKLNVNKATGAGEELKEVGKYRPEFAGVLLVWHDPKAKKDFVVNGHHRYELARRAKHPVMAIHYIQAPDAQQARAIGALANIAEGRGTAIDAAKFMRDTGRDVESMRAEGISLKGKVADEAATLSKLSPGIFNRVTLGTFPQGRAMAIASELDDHAEQDQIAKYIDKQEDKGKKISDDVAREMAREVSQTPRTTSTSKDLFGTIQDEHNLFMERNQLKSWLRDKIGSEVAGFKAVSTEKRAKQLQRGENVINPELNRAIAREAEAMKMLFDGTVNLKGNVSNAINDASEEWFHAKNAKQRSEIQSRLWDRVRNSLSETLGLGVQGGVQASEGNAGERPGVQRPDAGRGGRGPEPEYSVAADASRMSHELLGSTHMSLDEQITIYDKLKSRMRDRISRNELTKDEMLQAIQLAWDGSKHPRGHEGNPGQFVMVMESDAPPIVAEGDPSVLDPAKHWLSQAASLPSNLLAKARASVQTKYDRLERRYGRAQAIAIVGAGIAGLALPVPGSSFLTAAPLVGLAELYHRYKASRMDLAVDNCCPQLSQADIERMGRDLVDELLEEFDRQQIEMSLDRRYRLDVQHAPKGYTKEKPLMLAGHAFVGGQFIPSDVMAKATPQEKARLETEGHPDHPANQHPASQAVPVDSPLSDQPTPPPPGEAYRPNVEKVGQHGVTLAARVGVPAMELPPPPPMPRIPNLNAHEREVESTFASAFEANPEAMVQNFLQVVQKSTKPGEAMTFGTDDAKVLAAEWGGDDLSVRSQNRATLNVALHQTANAITKRAFLKHLDTLKKGDQIMVTVGGCGAGKGYAISSKDKDGNPNVPQAAAVKAASKVIWDSAGDQNATENPWIQAEAEKRGLKVAYVYVHADPKKQWADPERGVVKRAEDPKDGRMVDAKVFADSYALGAKNFHAFYQKNKGNQNASFMFLANAGKPTLLPGIPKEALEIDRHELAKFAVETVQKGQAPAHIKAGATIGQRLWGEKD